MMDFVKQVFVIGGCVVAGLCVLFLGIYYAVSAACRAYHESKRAVDERYKERSKKDGS